MATSESRPPQVLLSKTWSCGTIDNAMDILTNPTHTGNVKTEDGEELEMLRKQFQVRSFYVSNQFKYPTICIH